MITPCDRRVLCPPGTGTDSPGKNYSAEHIDVPRFPSIYYPPVGGYGYHTACQGRCISIVSQSDADLCAQKLGKLCQNDGGGGNGGPGPTTPPAKPSFTNTQQSCTIQATGKLVVVPAGIFVGTSQAEADAIALDYANKLQTSPTTPTGTTVVPTPTGGPFRPPGPIPTPEPQKPPPPPPPPPASQCKPCDDTAAVNTFAFHPGVSAGTAGLVFDTFPLKCGTWKLNVTGGPYPDGTPDCTIAMGLFIPDDPDPTKWTELSWENFMDCPQPGWVCRCSSDPDCAAVDTQMFALVPGCCGTTEVNCGKTACVSTDKGNFLMVMRFYYTCNVDSPPSRAFSITGVLQP